MRMYFKKIGQYIIDLKYLNKHLFSNKNVFLVFKNWEKKNRIPLVDQKVIALNKTKNISIKSFRWHIGQIHNQR